MGMNENMAHTSKDFIKKKKKKTLAFFLPYFTS